MITLLEWTHSLVPQVREMVVLLVPFVQMGCRCYHNGVVVNNFFLLVLHYSLPYNDELVTT
jgi:hypothetical protein